jgi:phosphatidylglycerophosphate synthase
MPNDRRPLTTRNAAWVQALARWLAARRVTPNAISIAGMVFATLGGAALVTPTDCAHCMSGLLFIAAAAIQLRLLCNLLDGLVAVEGGLKGRAGDLFNEAPDRYADIVLLAGAGVACGKPWLGWMAAAFAVLTAYVRAFGASLGKGQDFCGPFAKPQRMFFLTVGTLAAAVQWSFPRVLSSFSVLQGTLWLVAAGSLFTAVRRVARLYRQLP